MAAGPVRGAGQSQFRLNVLLTIHGTTRVIVTRPELACLKPPRVSAQPCAFLDNEASGGQLVQQCLHRAPLLFSPASNGRGTHPSPAPLMQSIHPTNRNALSAA